MEAKTNRLNLCVLILNTVWCLQMSWKLSLQRGLHKNVCIARDKLNTSKYTKVKTPMIRSCYAICRWFLEVIDKANLALHLHLLLPKFEIDGYSRLIFSINLSLRFIANIINQHMFIILIQRERISQLSSIWLFMHYLANKYSISAKGSRPRHLWVWYSLPRLPVSRQANKESNLSWYTWFTWRYSCVSFVYQ